MLQNSQILVSITALFIVEGKQLDFAEKEGPSGIHLLSGAAAIIDGIQQLSTCYRSRGK
jgi:hypothetical protein